MGESAKTLAFRLDVSPDDPTLVQGLRGEVADPVWLVAVQRTLGETQAVDGGSPAAADLATQASQVDAWLPRLPDGSSGQPLPSAPLEVVFENERQPDDHDMGTAVRLGALAGRQYLRLLPSAAAGTSLATYRNALRAQYPLDAAAPETDDPLIAIAAGRGIDGRALYHELDASLRGTEFPRLPAKPPVSAADKAAVMAAAESFLAWFDAVTGDDLASTTAWLPERFEYQVALGCEGDGEARTTFVADEYSSGRLEWHDFDIAAGASVGPPAGAAAPATETTRYLPTPVHFSGAPVQAHWVFEDASIELGAVEASAEDLATMVVVDFAVRYSNDFFLVPLPLRAGGLTAVTELTVTDTFGETLTIAPASVEGGQFRLFEHTVQGSDERLPAILLPPAVTGALDADPFEAVILLRDQIGDICWALERAVLGPTGEPIDLSSMLAQARPEPAPPEPDAAGTLTFHLRRSIASNWYPVVADPANANLLRVVQLETLPGEDPRPAPSSRILTELAASDAGIPAEEVTREGLSVDRRWRYARGGDGTQYLWTARRARPAPPVAIPNLGFDQATP